MLDRNLVAALLTWCLALLAGCGQAEVEPGVEAGMTVSSSSYPRTYLGPDQSIEERIVGADVVARVRMVSVEGGTATAHSSYPTWHIATMKFRFRVLEYLKGSGGSEIVGVVPEEEPWFPIAAEARTRARELLADRDTRWDGREAIVFLVSEAGEYLLGYATTEGEDGYTVASRWSKNWLPEATTTSPSGRGGAIRR